MADVVEHMPSVQSYVFRPMFVEGHKNPELTNSRISRAEDQPSESLREVKGSSPERLMNLGSVWFNGKN